MSSNRPFFREILVYGIRYDERQFLLGLILQKVTIVAELANVFNSYGLRRDTAEVRCQLYVALDQAYINDKEFAEMFSMGEEVARMIGGLIGYLRGSKYKGTKYKR